MHRIMVVDDEAVITTHLELCLTSFGYKVVGNCSSGEEAVAIAKRLKPNLILMDIVMPGAIDGIEASKRIKAEMDIPIIFLTAYAEDKFITKAKVVEPFGYLLKPFQEKELKACIEVALYRKDIDRQLRESEERYRSVVDTASEAIIIINSREKIVSWNHAAETIFGYPANESVGQLFSLLVPDRFIKDFRNEMDRIASTGNSNSFGKIIRFNGVRKNGKIFPMEFSLTTWKAEKKYFFTIIARDISERKLAEEKLKKSHERLTSVLDSLDAKVYVIDLNSYEILFVNKFTRDLHGDVIGKICWKHIQEEGQIGPCNFCSNDKLLDAHSKLGGVYSREFQNQISGRYYEIRERAIKWVDGRIVKLEIAIDITDRRNMEKEREKLIADKLKAIEQIKTLKGMLPICCSCKKIRHDNGYWQEVEGYIEDHTSVEFTHGMCSDCLKKHYQEFDLNYHHREQEKP